MVIEADVFEVARLLFDNGGMNYTGSSSALTRKEQEIIFADKTDVVVFQLFRIS